MRSKEEGKAEQMKWIFFSGDITRSGGTEKVATMIANALAAENKYDVVFLSLMQQSDKPFFALNDRIQRYALNTKWIRPGPGYLKVIPKLRRFLKQQEIDVIVDIDIVLDALALPAARRTGTKVVSWEHFNCAYEAESWYRWSILKYSVKRSDYIVTLTAKDKQAYGAQLGRTDRFSAIHSPMQEYAERGSGSIENWIVTVGHLINR